MNVFDQWRAAYGELTPAGHRLVASLMAMIWPVQRHYRERAVRNFLSVANPRSVVEFGGYDGALAAAMLPECPDIESWTNYDLVEVPQVCEDSRYSLGPLRQADALVASHSFEHITATELLDVVQGVQASSVFVDSPLPQDGAVDWRGYEGTHILPLSWHDLDTLLVAQGYVESGRWATNGSHARSYRMAA